ncbi:MAG: hypothetical protein M3Z59_07425, partial [Bombella apis]|nr:hypothetical protein [Bombella apis]
TFFRLCVRAPRTMIWLVPVGVGVSVTLCPLDGLYGRVDAWAIVLCNISNKGTWCQNRTVRVQTAS